MLDHAAGVLIRGAKAALEIAPAARKPRCHPRGAGAGLCCLAQGMACKMAISAGLGGRSLDGLASQSLRPRL
eukprot:11840538-Alexandrium_andersonii.AAC.1